MKKMIHITVRTNEKAALGRPKKTKDWHMASPHGDFLSYLASVGIRVFRDIFLSIFFCELSETLLAGSVVALPGSLERFPRGFIRLLS